MAAVVAASAMAVEFSAQAKVEGNVFSFEKADSADKGTIKAFTINNPADTAVYDGGTGLQFSVSGEKAGASYRIHKGGTLDGVGIWVKPVDFLKIQLGDYGVGLNKESITWTRVNHAAGGVAAGWCDSSAWFGGNGFNFQLAPVAGLTVDVGFAAPGWGFGSWASGNGETGVIGMTTFQVAYGADFGSAKVVGEVSSTDMVIAAEYSGNFGPLSLVVNGGAALFNGNAAKKNVTNKNLELVDEALNRIFASAFVQFNQDALTVKGLVDFQYNNVVSGYKTSDISDDKTKTNTMLDMKIAAKVDYSLGSATPFAIVSFADVFSTNPVLKVNPGVEFNVGEAHMKVGADMDITIDNDGVDAVKSGKFAIGVPVEVSISL